jgi:hypothetical protein
MARIKAKQITLKASGKFYAGLTDVDYSSTVKTETSLIKEDDGIEQKEIVGFEEKFSISGIICVNETGETSTHTDWAGLRTAYKAKTKVPFAYGMGVTGKPEITGNLLLLSISEKSGSTGHGTYSAECEIVQDADLEYGVTPTV